MHVQKGVGVSYPTSWNSIHVHTVYPQYLILGIPHHIRTAATSRRVFRVGHCGAYEDRRAFTDDGYFLSCQR